MSEPAHLCVYRFEPGAAFEGGLVGAIERMQLGHDVKLLDALFLRRDLPSGALDAVDLATGGGDATFASLLDFRLEPRRRLVADEPVDACALAQVGPRLRAAVSAPHT